MFRWKLIIGMVVLMMGLVSDIQAAGGSLPGAGTEENPYLIEDLADFDWFLEYYRIWGDHIRLMCDIDLSSKAHFTAALIETTKDRGFCGTFDGNGHTISNFTIDGGDGDYMGVFGALTESALIQNLGIEAANISGAHYVGGLCGYNGGTISDCYSNADVTGINIVGGLIGDNDGQITNCYSSGEVTGGLYIGGLCGRNKSEISTCYSTGAVIDTDHIGGFCGANISGWLSRGIILDCFWDKDTSGKIISSGGRPKITEQMKQATTFIGWNNGHWTIDEGNDSPRLTWQAIPGVELTTDYPTRTYNGDGSPENPFVLEDSADLICLSDRPEDWCFSFILANTINMSEATYYPIAYFSGTLDGQGYAIENLGLDQAIIGVSDQLGLFGRLESDSRVEHLKLIDSVITGHDYVGTLCGYNDGSIIDCSSVGSVHGERIVGGLCGSNWGSLSACYSVGNASGHADVGGLCGENISNITACYSAGTVTGNDYTGGLCGYNEGLLTNCYSTATVTGNNRLTGGLCGYQRGDSMACYSSGIVTGNTNVGGICGLSSGELTACYSTSTVSGNIIVGGLCGDNRGNITRCYSRGLVTGDKSVGGLCGLSDTLYTGGNILSCFWDMESSGLTESSGGTGKTTSQMKQMKTFTDAGWDMTSVWAIGINQTYPYLRDPSESTLQGDVNNDKTVDLEDLAILANHWLKTQ